MKATTKATLKATHEMFITVCKYAFYQDPKNYEGNKEGKDEGNTCLNTIHKMKMRLTENVQKTTRIAVCKYDSYQDYKNY